MKYCFLLATILLYGIYSEYGKNIDKNIFRGGRIVNSNEIGCCFDVGFSNLMIPIYNNHRDIDKGACPIENRLGGSTQFSNLNCSKLKILQVKMPIKKKEF